MVDQIDTRRENAAMSEIQGGIVYASVPGHETIQNANMDSRNNWFSLLNYHGNQTNVKKMDDPILREELNRRVATVFKEDTKDATTPTTTNPTTSSTTATNNATTSTTSTTSTNNLTTLNARAKVQHWIDGCIREVEGTCSDIANWKGLPGSTTIEKCRHILNSKERRKYLLIIGLILISIILIIIAIFSSH